jgi:multiple sugar transport system permease protein
MHSPRFVAAALTPAFLFLSCFYLYPILFNVGNSLTDTTLFQLKNGGEFVGLANFAELLSSPDFFRVLWNTVFWLTFVGVSTRVLLGLALALALNSRIIERMKVRTLFRILILVPWATPPIVAIVIWRWMLDARVGELNKLLLALGFIDQPIAFLGTAAWVWPALIVIITWNTLPLMALSFLASLQSLPEELVEAAAIDGASPLQVVRYISLPHLKPTIIVMILMSTFWTFNNFVYVWLTTGAGPGYYTNVMATEVYIKAFIDGRLGYSSAVGVVMALLMGAFGILYMRIVTQRSRFGGVM